MIEVTRLLQSCYLFKGLSEQQLRCMSEISEEMQIKKAQWLFHEGKPADQIFCLNQGAVELITEIDDGFELPIKILRSKGSCFGIAALVAPYLYSLSARCAEDGSVLAIKQADLEHLISQDNEMGCILMSNMCRDLLERLKEARQELKIHFKTLFKFVRT